MANRTYELYRIDWVDAHSMAGWKDIGDIKVTDYVVHSAGWLVQKNKKYYVLAQQMSSSGTCNDLMNIPRSWIKKIYKLKNKIQYE